MSGEKFLSRVKSVFKKEPMDCALNDTAPFDFSDELGEDETPKFNKLKVVVSGVTGNFPDDVQANRTSVAAIVEDDDSLLGSSPRLGSPTVVSERCEACAKRREMKKRSRVTKKLAIAALLYLLFMIGELVGGYIANSLAIMTDALHMLTDLIGVVVSLLALWLSARLPTKTFTFGLHRLEVLSAGISVLLIYTLAGVLLNEAIQRTIHQDFDINGDVMLITAAVGVAVNVIMGFVLNQSGHPHSHTHSHSHTQPAPNSPQQSPQGSLVIRAAFIHALGDLVQSVGVLLAAYIVRFKPEYKVADPICTYIFSVLVLFTTVKIVWDTGLVLLEGVPRHVDVVQIRKALAALEHIHSVEDLNVWALTPEKTAALVHLQLSPSSGDNWEEAQASVRDLLMNTYGFYKCTVQLQRHRVSPPLACSQCQHLPA